MRRETAGDWGGGGGEEGAAQLLNATKESVAQSMQRGAEAE